MYIDYLIVSLIPLFIVVVFPLPYVRFIFLYSSHSIFLFAHQLTLSLRLGLILPVWSDLTVRRILGVPPLARDIRTESLRRPVCEKLFQPNASRCPLPYSLNWLRLSAFLIKRGEGTPTLLVCFFRTLMVKPKTPSSAWQRQPNNTWTEVKKEKGIPKVSSSLRVQRSSLLIFFAQWPSIGGVHVHSLSRGRVKIRNWCLLVVG